MKIPLNPPFSKGDDYSSLWQREVGRDLKKLSSKQVVKKRDTFKQGGDLSIYSLD